jgi:hypothetical protein
MKTRDMSDKQFREALQRHGFELQGFMGYVRMPIPGHHYSVSFHNAGKNHRSQLAYLLRKLDELRKQLGVEAA